MTNFIISTKKETLKRENLQDYLNERLMELKKSIRFFSNLDLIKILAGFSEIFVSLITNRFLLPGESLIFLADSFLNVPFLVYFYEINYTFLDALRIMC